MRATIATMAIVVALSLGAGVWATSPADPVAQQAQADQVTVLKVEGLT